MTRFPVKMLAACVAIIAVTLPVRADSDESHPDCIAMLDMITTCSDQRAMTQSQSAMAAPETTGSSGATREADAAASPNGADNGADPLPDDFYKFVP